MDEEIKLAVKEMRVARGIKEKHDHFVDASVIEEQDALEEDLYLDVDK